MNNKDRVDLQNMVNNDEYSIIVPVVDDGELWVRQIECGSVSQVLRWVKEFTRDSEFKGSTNITMYKGRKEVKSVKLKDMISALSTSTCITILIDKDDLLSIKELCNLFSTRTKTELDMTTTPVNGALDQAFKDKYTNMEIALLGEKEHVESFINVIKSVYDDTSI